MPHGMPPQGHHPHQQHQQHQQHPHQQHAWDPYESHQMRPRVIVRPLACASSAQRR
jgi:hypothetical protein